MARGGDELEDRPQPQRRLNTPVSRRPTGRETGRGVPGRPPCRGRCGPVPGASGGRVVAVCAEETPGASLGFGSHLTWKVKEAKILKAVLRFTANA